MKITAINLALRNLFGYVIWGNSLTNERKLVYATGFNGKGFVREGSIEELPVPPVQTGPAPPGPEPGAPQEEKEVIQGSLFE